MRNLFNMDSGLFRVLGRMADLMILNIIFLLCCIPIVTIGPALTAMFYVTLKLAVNEEGYIARAFFKSFRQNFRQALVIWLLVLLLGIVLTLDLLILRNATGTAYMILRVLILATAFVAFMTFIYVFPTLARFDNTIRGTLRNALLMSIIDFPRTVIMIVITVGAAFITFYNGYTITYGLLFWIMLGFATVAYVNSRFLAKVFKKYMPEEEKDDTEDHWELDMDGEPAEAEAAPSGAFPEIPGEESEEQKVPEPDVVDDAGRNSEPDTGNGTEKNPE